MKTEYVIKEIKEDYGGLKLTLIKYIPPKPEPVPLEPEEEEYIPDPLETFVPETDEEKVMVKIFKAMRKMGLLPELPPKRPSVMPMVYSPPLTIEIRLTKEEYAELDKPGIDQTLEIEIKKV